jgi:PAS domain S-box-containing protein
VQFVERLAAIRTDGFAAFETAHVSREGSVHLMELSCRTYTYGDSHIVLAIVRRPDHPLQASAESLQLAVEASRIGLFDWDLRTNRVVYSTGWKALLGYSEGEISNDFGEWELRVHADDVDKMVADLKAYLGTRGKGYEAEFRMRRKDGAYRWMLARGAVLYGDDGQPERMLGSHADVTDRKRADQHLWQAKKLEAVSRLASGVGHDLNHLLTIMNGYSDLILPGLYEGDPLRDQIQAIRDAGKRAEQLTAQLLGLTQRPANSHRVVNLNQLVSDMEEMLRRLLGSGVELVTEPSPVIPYLKAEPGRMVQLLMNLALNAKESMPEGGRLAVSVQVVEALPSHMTEEVGGSGPYVRLTVADTGPGVDDETRLQLFDPFFNRNSTDRGNPGLPAVYGIVKQHGGAIAATGDVGKGTQFQVFFPLTPPEQPVVDTPPRNAGSPTTRGTVLVVERDPALRRLAAEALLAVGHQVLEMADAGEAILFSEDHPGIVDVLVTDIGNPATCGPRLAERLLQWHPDLKPVFLTADPESHRHAVAKPFSPGTLVQAVLDALVRGPV